MITFDLETKSYADLGKVGQHAYSEHPTTKVICGGWGIEDEDIVGWVPGVNDDILDDLFYAICVEKMPIEAHNASFEWSMFENVLGPQYDFPMPGDWQWRDTMAQAAYYAMPMALDKLCYALGFKGKDPEGGRLITKYSKLYLKTAKTRIPDGSEEDWVTWSKMTESEKKRHPEAQDEGGFYRDDLGLFVEYCKRDVLLEQTVSDELGDLPDEEQLFWTLDFKINQRGLKLDAEGIKNATAVVDQRAEELTKQFRSIVGYNPTQRDKCLAWFQDKNIPLENLQADHIEEVLDEYEVPQSPARTALEIRRRINKASTKKLDAMARQASEDGYARFQTRFHGAVTGRDTGSGFQPLNLVRSWEHVDPNRLCRDISYRDARWLDCVYGDAMEAVSKAGRHWIIAGEGEEICAGDFVSVEAVVLACLAGEQWKIEAFRNKEKIYERMGDRIYKLPAGTVSKDTHPLERHDGKTAELAFGYQGALNAWLKFDNSGRHSDDRIIEICRAWRDEHPQIRDSWYSSEAAMFEALVHPGRETSYKDLGFAICDEWLTMILPDGKRLWYRDPQIREQYPAMHRPKEFEECAAGECGHKKKPTITYMANKNGRWGRVSTYGGKIMENATQAVSRQILKSAINAAENAGYKTVLKVYDEVVTRNPIGFANKERFEEILICQLPTFARDWPIRADAWIGQRYKK